MENKNILIVDDDASMIKFFELIAKKEGYTVISAPNGVEGLKKFNKQDFALVITDLKMPLMDGIEFIKKARKPPRFMNFPFIVITGNFKEFSAEVALLKNLTILEKPIKQKDLEDLLRNNQQVPTISEGKTIPIGEIQEFLTEKTKKISSQMLEIITKSAPEVKIIKPDKYTKFFEGDFFVTHSLILGNQKVSVVFVFDVNLSKAITIALAKNSESNSELTLECLNKVGISLVKKIFENSPYSSSYNSSNPIFLFGNGEEKSLFGTEQNNFLTSIYFKNDLGTLVVHLLKH